MNLLNQSHIPLGLLVLITLLAGCDANEPESIKSEENVTKINRIIDFDSDTEDMNDESEEEVNHEEEGCEDVINDEETEEEGEENEEEGEESEENLTENEDEMESGEENESMG